MKIRVFIIRLEKEYFETDQNTVNSFLEKVQFKKSSSAFVEGENSFWSVLIHFEELPEEDSPSPSEEAVKSPIITYEDLNPEELEIVKQLKKWRNQRAEIEELPVFMILSNSDIYTIARAQPKEITDFIGLRGFGEKKIGRYGEEIIALLNSI